MMVCALPPVGGDEAGVARAAGGAGAGGGRDSDGGCHDRSRRDDCGSSDGRVCGLARWRPHDVLRLRRLPVLDGEPAWVREAFLHAPFAVVRRASSASGFVAVGIRGANRAQRYGTWVEDEDVEFAVSPEALVERDPASARECLPAFSVLAELRRSPCSLGQFVWGPAGSVGFELATALPTATGSSDLDLLIRAPERLDHAAAGRLLSELLALAQRAGVRIDAQLETPAGGVALAELAGGKRQVMARANTGASLVTDPWTAGAAVDSAPTSALTSARENAPRTRSAPQSAQTSDAQTGPTGGGTASATPKWTRRFDVR
ncbi:MAG TPA: malonate decarboxylase holo-ACP synthase [Paraburkholderia sp.]|jgi:phosphoribosyl-dephospho-CoA transferase